MFKIMIVEDELISQKILQQYIATKLPEYKITHVCNHGREALEKFNEEAVDILLVDIRMPMMNGLDFLKKLKEISIDYVVIIMSSYNEFEYAKEAISLGVCHYLLKPIDFVELEEALGAANIALKNKRIVTSRGNEISYEVQKEYFRSIVSAIYTDENTAICEWNNAGFKIPYDSNGVYLQVEYKDITNWSYGSEELITAIKNILIMLYNPRICISVNYTTGNCQFVLMVKELPQNFHQLHVQVRTLLNVSIYAKEILVFYSVEELRKYIIKNMNDSLVNSIMELDSESMNKERIEKAIEYMQIHYVEDLSRNTIAEKVFISPAHFSRCFKMYTGMSYKDYLTEIRMKKAIEMLSTSMKISDIALKCGYQNSGRFIINFRQYTGFTPTEYRIKMLKIF